MVKIWTWILANGASVLGIIQAVIKAVKEILTAVVNLLSIFIPSDKIEKIVMTVRNILNKIDEWIEIIKEKLL
jgi:archaellum component FlaC